VGTPAKAFSEPFEEVLGKDAPVCDTSPVVIPVELIVEGISANAEVAMTNELTINADLINFMFFIKTSN
jgi:hypothetical protein